VSRPDNPVRAALAGYFDVARAIDAATADSNASGDRSINNGSGPRQAMASNDTRESTLLSPTRRLLIQSASDIESEDIRWLWPGYVPFGKVTMLEGDPGVGKSALTMMVAAAVSTGRGDWLPGGSSFKARDVLIVSYEDGAADTIRPRLVAAGAELSRVHIVQGVHTDAGEDLVTLPTDIASLDDAIRRYNAALVIIDPLMAAFSSTIDSHKDQHVRRALAPLKRVAEDSGAAVLVVRHLVKSVGRRAITSGGGSIGIAAATRAVLVVDKSPSDPTRRILAVVKVNIAADAPSLEFSLETATYPLAGGTGTTVVVKWRGTSSVTAADLAAQRSDVAEPGAVTQQTIAAECLREWLGDGPATKQELLRLSRQQGISDRTLERAAGSLKLVRDRRGSGRDHKMLWSLPYGLSTLANPIPTRGGESESGESRAIPGSERPTTSWPSSSAPHKPTLATSTTHRGVGESGETQLETGVFS
jgi:archaellum biogenesis ATPase FlaH